MAGFLDPVGDHYRRVGMRVASNNLFALLQMCEQGLSIARFAHADALPALSRGTLLRLLPGWHFSPMPVAAVTPQRDGESAKVRVARARILEHVLRGPSPPGGL